MPETTAEILKEPTVLTDEARKERINYLEYRIATCQRYEQDLLDAIAENRNIALSAVAELNGLRINQD